MLKDKNFMNISAEIAKWSKCVAKQVWAVIVKDNRILSTWYNWTPSWYVNCCDFFNWKHTKEHHDWSLKYEIHAEMNAILRAARNNISIEWATIYCSYEPCFNCTKHIIWAWIKRIVYGEKYKDYKTNEAEIFIKEAWVQIEQFSK